MTTPSNAAMDVADCPCCGSDAHIIPHSTGLSVRFKVVCEHCGLATQTYSTEADALASWNRRDASQSAALLEALRKYGRHHRDCDKRYGENDGMDYSAAACTCGFTALAEQQREEG